jgi:hypothetical protein
MALAETLLLAGRIEFFHLRQPDDADATFVRALQAAGEADDALLGSAILAHAAFLPGWVGRRDETADRMRASRTYARRGPASAEFLAWLDAVEAECETISSHTREASSRPGTCHKQRKPCSPSWTIRRLQATGDAASSSATILDVRKILQPDAGLDCVQRLDDRLYDWQANAQHAPALNAAIRAASSASESIRNVGT